MGGRLSGLFIVDNGDKNWKAKNYLSESVEFASKFDLIKACRYVQDTQWDHTRDKNDEGSK